MTAVGKELGTYDARYLGLATRICAELGADIVKTYHTDGFKLGRRGDGARGRRGRETARLGAERAGAGERRGHRGRRRHRLRAQRGSRMIPWPPSRRCRRSSTTGTAWTTPSASTSASPSGPSGRPVAGRGRLLDLGAGVRAPHSPACFLIHGQQGTRELPYTLAVLQSGQRTVLVDTGFVNDGFSRTLGELDGITRWTHHSAVLDRVGVDPGQVDTILLTHAHYDHLGTLDEFPNAVAWLQERELFGWIRALDLPPEMQWLKDGVNADDTANAFELTRQGRASGWWTGASPRCSRLCLEPTFDTHTYGHQHVVGQRARRRLGAARATPSTPTRTSRAWTATAATSIGFATGSQRSASSRCTR